MIYRMLKYLPILPKELLLELYLNNLNIHYIQPSFLHFLTSSQSEN
jgi:hypothetical protein